MTGLVDVPPAVGRNTSNPAPTRLNGSPLAQLHQHQQRPLVGSSARHGRADPPAVAADQPCHEGQGLVLQGQRGMADQRREARSLPPDLGHPRLGS
jgi:hypothetical protein